MTTLFAAIWIAGVWALLLVALGAAATIPLMRRRDPDPADDPAHYGMTREEITFTSRDGLRLGGYWIPVDSARGTVIMCPGQNGSLDKDIPQAVPLHRAGFNVLMFDFRAHGRSEGELVTIGALEQADLFGALDYLETARGITRVGVFGLSMGAGVALMVAAQDQRIAAAVVDGAYPTLAGILSGYLRIRGVPDLLARPFARLALLVGSLRAGYDIRGANPADLAGRIGVPVLFIHGERDPFVRGDAVEALRAQVSAETDLWRVADCGHREAFALHPDAYNARVVAWFTRHL